MGYLKDGPCRKLTSLFFKVKKLMFSLAKIPGAKVKIMNSDNINT